jgi:hypothetical protein
MAAQYLSTSRLANVIHLISLGQQSGILRVVRGQGASREVGQIQFVDGQPTAALLGHLSGSAAINVLNNWGESYYAFDEGAVGDNSYAGTPEGESSGAAYGSWPSNESGWGTGQPSPAPASPPGSGSLSGSLPSGSWPSYGYPSPTPPRLPSVSSTPPPAGFGQTGALPGGPWSESQPGVPAGFPTMTRTAPSAPSTTGSPLAVPRRVARDDQAEPLPLDRRERMVLLLVDGRRNIADLARLTRRSEGEVQSVIGHLRMLRLVE